MHAPPPLSHERTCERSRVCSHMISHYCAAQESFPWTLISLNASRFVTESAASRRIDDLFAKSYRCGAGGAGAEIDNADVFEAGAGAGGGANVGVGGGGGGGSRRGNNCAAARRLGRLTYAVGDPPPMERDVVDVLSDNEAGGGGGGGAIAGPGAAAACPVCAVRLSGRVMTDSLHVEACLGTAARKRRRDVLAGSAKVMRGAGGPS